jgi:hypothetical protein
VGQPSNFGGFVTGVRPEAATSTTPLPSHNPALQSHSAMLDHARRWLAV